MVVCCHLILGVSAANSSQLQVVLGSPSCRTGLLATVCCFSAQETCESKTAEVRGVPVSLRLKKGLLEPNRNALAPMQTACPLGGTCIWVSWTCQSATCMSTSPSKWSQTQGAPWDSKMFPHTRGEDSHNSGQRGQQFHIIVGAYEGQYAYNNCPSVPHAPNLAQAGSFAAKAGRGN